MQHPGSAMCPNSRKEHSGPFVSRTRTSRLLAGARPLPFGDEMIIEELAADEQRDFLDAIKNEPGTSGRDHAARVATRRAGTSGDSMMISASALPARSRASAR